MTRRGLTTGSTDKARSVFCVFLLLGGFGASGEEEMDIASRSLGRREPLKSKVLEPAGALEQRTHLHLREPARVRDDMLVFRRDDRRHFFTITFARNIGYGERAAGLQVRDELARDLFDRSEMVVRHRALKTKAKE
jgi:hypothetical protein